jgi:hypothetical protein
MYHLEIDNPSLIDDGLRLLREFHSESAYSEIPLVDLKLENFLRQQIESDRSIVIFLVRDEKPVGIMICVISWYFFSNEKIAEDHVLFVEKESRGSPAVLRMIKKYIEWAKSNEVREISIATSARILE